MGKYDNVDKDYFLEPERIAELFAVGVHHGHASIRAEDLELDEKTYPSLVSPSGQLDRDGAYLCKRHGVKYALEIENFCDYGMPRRIMVYDASDYEHQTKALETKHKKNKDFRNFAERKSKITEKDRYYPVINLVLYLGGGHWPGKRHLRELFQLPEQYKAIIHDKIQNYTFSLLEADYVDPNLFHTDLRMFFTAMQCRLNAEKLTQFFETLEGEDLPYITQKVIAEHLGLKELATQVKEGENMCKAYRDLKKQLLEEGRQEGRQEGRLEERIRAIMELLDAGMTKEFILKLKYTEEEYAEAILQV